MIVSTCYQKISSNQFHHIAIILLIIHRHWEVYRGLNAKNMISNQRGKSHFIFTKQFFPIGIQTSKRDEVINYLL